MSSRIVTFDKIYIYYIINTDNNSAKTKDGWLTKTKTKTAYDYVIRSQNKLGSIIGSSISNTILQKWSDKERIYKLLLCVSKIVGSEQWI